MLPARGKRHGRRGVCAVLLSFIVFAGCKGVEYATFSMETYRLLLNKCFPLEENDMHWWGGVKYATFSMTVTELVHISRGELFYNVHVKIEVVPWEYFCLEPQWMLLTPHYAVYNVGSANI